MSTDTHPDIQRTGDEPWHKVEVIEEKIQDREVRFAYDRFYGRIDAQVKVEGQFRTWATAMFVEDRFGSPVNEWEINWSGCGPQDVATTTHFAAMLERLVAYVESL